MKTELLHSNSSKSLLTKLSREASSNSLFSNSTTTEDLSQSDSTSRKSSEDGSTAEIVHSVSSSSSSGSTSGKDGNVASAWAQQWYKSTFRKKTAMKRLPILDWSRNYTWQKFAADFIAGITVGLTILPQGLAYASLAGLPPQVHICFHTKCAKKW